jgi:hypothetical protein
MKIKLIKSNDIQKLEILVNNFISDIQVIKIKIFNQNEYLICYIQYLE